MKSAAKATQLVLALVLTTNTVYAAGNIQINVPLNAQAKDAKLASEVSHYYEALSAYSKARLNDTRFNTLQAEIEKNQKIYQQKRQELNKINTLIAQSSGDNEAIYPLAEAHQKASKELQEIGAVITQIKDVKEIFIISTFNIKASQFRPNMSVLAVLDARDAFADAKMQVIRRVTVKDQAAFLQQLNQYEKTKDAWIQSQILMKQIDDLNNDLELIARGKLANLNLVEKYGKISAEPSAESINYVFGGALLSMVSVVVADLVKSKTVANIGSAAAITLAGIGVYMVYKQTAYGSDIQKTKKIIADKLSSIKTELTKLNDELQRSTEDMELIIESTK